MYLRRKFLFLFRLPRRGIKNQKDRIIILILRIVKSNQLLLSSIISLCFNEGSRAVWPDWAIYWTLGNFLKPLATINLPKSLSFLANFCKGVKIYHFSKGNFYRHLVIFSGHTDQGQRRDIIRKRKGILKWTLVALVIQWSTCSPLNLAIPVQRPLEAAFIFCKDSLKRQNKRQSGRVGL